MNHQSYFALRPFEASRCVIYAIQLDASAIHDPAFAAKNPGWIPGMELFYIGLTSLTPRERFGQHLLGTKNVSRIAHRYGRNLRMDVVTDSKACRRTFAAKKEARLVRDLRAKGFGAWMG